MRSEPVTDWEFASLMARLGPFEFEPKVAVAVSGGPDSMALCLLTARWVGGRGGSVTALIVDHGIRAESGAEARETADRLAGVHIRASILPIEGLSRGPGLAERARVARYAALEAACREQGVLHLLVGHQAGDQAETLMMRALSGSGNAGLAGMAAVTERTHVRILRPLLSVGPERLRATLRAAGVGWVEDPSNRDAGALRPRLRQATLTADRGVLGEAAKVAGRVRSAADVDVAEELAGKVSWFEEGFALLRPGRISAGALAAVVRTIAGAAYPVPVHAVQELADRPGPATVGGVRVLEAGRLGPGLLVVREEAAMAGRVPARLGVCWDGRFRLLEEVQEGMEIGALGDAAARLRDVSDLPAAVLRTLPALWLGDEVVSVFHLGGAAGRVVFSPPVPAAGAPFWVG